MAFQDVLNKIANDIIDNTDRLITPAVLRGVLNDIAQWAQDDKVDKVAGKGLSEEDFTTTLLNKLNGIAAGAEVNEVSASDLNDYIQKDFGIELANGKSAIYLQGVDLNNIVETGLYYIDNTSSNAPSGFAFFLLNVYRSGVASNRIHHVAISTTQKSVMRRTLNSTWNNWERDLTETDKTELLNKINKLSIDNVDLTEAGVWNATTKTLDLSSKIGVGILNFNTPAPTYTISDISVSSQATVSFDVDDSFGLIQEDSVVNFDSILGDPVFTQLNSGDYIAKNVDYQNRTFDIRKGDNSGWVDTSFSAIVDITDITSAAQAVVTVQDGNLLSENQIIEIKGAIGMELLEGLEFKVQNLDPGLGTFDLVDSQTGMGVDTQAMNYVSGGKVGNTPTFFPSGNATLKDDIVKIEIDKITGIDNGTQMKFSVSDGNEVTLNQTAIASAVNNDIVSSTTITIYGKGRIVRLLRHKNLNYVTLDFAEI